VGEILRRHRHGLVEQLPLLGSGDVLEGGLDEGKVRVVRDHGLRERGELHPLRAKFLDLPHDLVDRCLAAIAVDVWTPNGLLVARSRDGLDQAVAGATSTPFTVSIVL
jgi:hypothetical protein